MSTKAAGVEGFCIGRVRLHLQSWLLLSEISPVPYAYKNIPKYNNTQVAAVMHNPVHKACSTTGAVATPAAGVLVPSWHALSPPTHIKGFCLDLLSCCAP